jgi:hypothetical protein
MSVSVPDVFAVSPGGAANTIYIGYGPSSLTLNAVVSGGTPPYSYKWTIGSSAGAALSSQSSFTVSPTATTTYYLNVKDMYGCTVAAVTKTIKVVDVRCGPKLDKVTICQSQKGTFTTTCVTSSQVAGHLSNGASLGACATDAMITKTSNNGEDLKEAATTSLLLQASPNPARSFFTLKATSRNTQEQITITVVNALGKTVESRRITPGQNVTLGHNYRPGTYFCVATQGNEKASIKLTKLSD